MVAPEDDALKTSPLSSQPSTAPLDDVLADLVARVLNGSPVPSEVRARVLMPPADRFAVRLVPLHDVERLQDSDSDKSLWDALMWAFVGALIAFAAALPLSGDSPNAASIVVLIALATLTFGCIGLRLRYGRRSRNIRASFYDRQEP